MTVQEIILITILILKNIRAFASLEDDIMNRIKEKNSTILSRTRRYLIFPEGSSFQVVFDLTYPSVAIQGNAFMFGHTAAMAWELPSKPIFLDMKKLTNGKESAQTTTVEPSHQLDYYDWHAPMAPERSWTMNHYSPYIFQDNYPAQYNVNYPQQPAFIRRFLKRNKANRTVAHHIQRRSRRELYSKVENLLSAMSKDGKVCVLKAICQVHKLPSRKGTFWEEIIKAIFKPKHDQYPEDHYDRAANENDDCDKMYPSCDGHVLSNLFKNKVKKYE